MQCIGGLESYGRKRRSLRHKFSKSANSNSVKLEREKKEDAPDNKRNYVYKKAMILKQSLYIILKENSAKNLVGDTHIFTFRILLRKLGSFETT